MKKLIVLVALGLCACGPSVYSREVAACQGAFAGIDWQNGRGIDPRYNECVRKAIASSNTAMYQATEPYRSIPR